VLGAVLAGMVLRLLVFLVLLLVVRGLPSLLVYRRSLPLRQRIEMTFIMATTMPLLVALAAIGLADGVMIPANAAAMVGAGVLSVLIYPSVATAVARRDTSAAPDLAAPGRGAAAEGGVVAEARAVGGTGTESETGAGSGTGAAGEPGTAPAEPDGTG
jgi:hypothetical protein